MELMLAAGAATVLDGLALHHLFTHGRPARNKAFWTAIVVLVPLLGPLTYSLFGRDDASIA